MRSYALSPGAMRAPTDRSQTLPAGPQGAAPASRRPARTVPAPRPSAASRPVLSQPSTAQRCPHPTLPLEPSRSLQAAGRDGHKGLGGRIVPAPRSLPCCRSGFPGLRRAAVSVLSPGSPRGAARGAPQRTAGRDSAPASPPPAPAASPRSAPPRSRIAANPPRLTCRAALALRHGRSPPPRGSPQPTAHCSRRGMGRPRSPARGRLRCFLPSPPRRAFLRAVPLQPGPVADRGRRGPTPLRARRRLSEEH